ncbi:hypothetical protein FB566_2879 [Stackebrandtia endophytica]|uniref:Uncharacterized protein n=1 Tax=Stackebrandtia endophytica TaxID=1496996 RepID=A0A543AXL5_9ACTN|nr:hypothetical protein [Stackebrandtia endophytica]TQL77321.1 hypothetical protein FB566_2879 [Stackebrandtia endophytica]
MNATSSVDRTPKRGRLIVWISVATVLSVSVFAVAVGFLGSFGDGWARVVVVDDRVAFELRVPGGAAIDRVEVLDDAEGCALVRYGFDDYGLVVEAVSRSCEVTDRQIINGHHGRYRTMADVPAAEDVVTVGTNLGDAEIFVQQYAEYTNLTSKWTEPVAVVTFDVPVDPEYPTLVLRSEKAGLDRDEFTEVVAGLRTP